MKIAGIPNLKKAGRNHYFMTTVKLKENEPFEVAMRRFKRTIEKLDCLQICARANFMKNQQRCVNANTRRQSNGRIND